MILTEYCFNTFTMRKLVFFLVLLLNLTISQAHPPGLSSADVTVKTDGVEVRITFAVQDIEAFVPMDSDQDADVTDAEREAAKPAIAKLVAEQTSLGIDGKPVQPDAPGTVNFDQQNNAEVTIVYKSVPVTTISLQSHLLDKLPPDHKQYVTVKKADGIEIGKKMLQQQSEILEISLTGETQAAGVNQPSSAFSDFLKLGIEHIVTGYDHLLFLFSLLVITRSFWPALKIITFFTIAHSITLALAALNIVDIPSSVVEPLIAATIVYVGLENILRKDKVTTRQRCLLTFCFGLIHGFGFAGVLQEMGISSIETGILVPLFSFNLGVETGQIAIAGLVLPLIWWLHGKANVDRYLVPIGSILTSLAGGYWLLERTLLS